MLVMLPLARRPRGRLVGVPAPIHHARSRRACATAATPPQFAAFIPHPEATAIEEPAARAALAAMMREVLTLPSLGDVATAYLANEAVGREDNGLPPVVALHGFDSSCLEFRRLLPRLAERGVPAWAVDLVGWGFSDHAPFAGAGGAALGPAQKREHLYAFWKAKVGRPMTLLGASLGGAIALDFALAHPDAVAKLVLVDPQAYTDGLGPLAAAPRWVAALGLAVLRSAPLRRAANRMAYHDVARLATEDAMRVGRLHTHAPGWADANLAYIASGGYALSGRVVEARAPTLVLWGRQDKILDPAQASRFEADLPDGRLVWVDGCGHCAHLEAPDRAAEVVGAWVRGEEVF